MASMGDLAIGGQLLPASGGVSFASQLVDASNDGVGWVVRAHTANAITHLGFRYSARTGTPPAYIIAIEGVSNSTGNPDGTIAGGGSPASATFTPPADASWDGTWQWIALANSYVPAVGEQFAITIRYSSGTIDASNRSSFTVSASLSTLAGGEEYSLALTAGTWVKDGNIGVYGVRTASERYGLPVSAFYTTAIATNGHRIAAKFRIPSGATNIYNVMSFLSIGPIGSAGKKPKAGLWNAAGAALQDVTLDTDIARAPTTSNRQNSFHFDEATPADLSAGTWYYIGLEANDASPGSISICGLQCGSADDRQAFYGGANLMLATWDGAAWTDIDTVYPCAAPAIRSMTPQAGGGGSGGFVIGG